MAIHRPVQTSTVRKISSAVVFAFGVGAVAGTVLGFFGASWWGFDRMADWRLPLLLILAGAAIIYGFVFRRALSSVFLLAAIVNAALLAPMWLSQQPTAETSDRLRIATLDTSGADDQRRAVIEWINDEEADLALLHRTSGDWRGMLDETGVPYRVVPVSVGPEAIGRPLVLVRDGTTASPLDAAAGSDFTVRIVEGVNTVTVIGVAVARPGSSAEADRRIDRFSQLNAAASELSGPVVVAGNLEASRWSHAFSTIVNGMTNSEDGHGYAATWPSYDWPLIGSYTGLPLDHAVYRGAITVSYRRIGPDLGSSHRPLLFDVSPAGP